MQFIDASYLLFDFSRVDTKLNRKYKIERQIQNSVQYKIQFNVQIPLILM